MGVEYVYRANGRPTQLDSRPEDLVRTRQLLCKRCKIATGDQLHRVESETQEVEKRDSNIQYKDEQSRKWAI